MIKDSQKGIGCTIKNAAGRIFVYRILEDGPIAETGILRPGKTSIYNLIGDHIHSQPHVGLVVSSSVSWAIINKSHASL